MSNNPIKKFVPFEIPTKKVETHLTNNELLLVEHFAKLGGSSVSAWIRYAVLHRIDQTEGT